MSAIVPFEPTATPLQSLIEANIRDNTEVGRDPNARGVFAQTPVSTPKFVNFHPNRKQEYEDTMARMLLQVPQGTITQLINEMEDGDTQKILKILANDGSQGGFGYFDFFLQNATHSFSEKVQISESLADNYVAFFYGGSPSVFRYSGTLMNTFEDDWNMNMFRIFRDLGRGTQLARRGSLFYLRYDSVIVSGAMMNFNSTLMAGREMAVDFTFDFLVKKLEIVLGSYTKAPTDLQNMWEKNKTGNVVISSPSSPFANYDVQSKTFVGAPSGTTPGGVPKISLSEAAA